MWHRRTDPVPTGPDPGLAEAQQARRESTDALREAVSNTQEVRQLAGRMRVRRERNGFGELLERSMQLP